jgi:membrane-bound hydrogenase subunit beta
MNTQKIFADFRAALGSGYLDDRTIERRVGTLTPGTVYDLWIVVAPDAFRAAAEHLCAQHAPHLSVISGDDLGDSLALNYHFTVGWGTRYGEATLTLRTVLPKSQLSIPTLTDLLPGAQTAEREKIEFYGIEVVGAPDTRNLFLPEDATIHPWRKDLEIQTAQQTKRMVKWEERDE